MLKVFMLDGKDMGGFKSTIVICLDMRFRITDFSNYTFAVTLVDFVTESVILTGNIMCKSVFNPNFLTEFNRI